MLPNKKNLWNTWNLPLSDFFFSSTSLNSIEMLFLYVKKSKELENSQLWVLHLTLLNIIYLPQRTRIYISFSVSIKLLPQKQTVQRANCESLKEAFLRRDSLVNGGNLKSPSLLLINQPTLARTLVALTSHDHLTVTWQAMWERKSFSIT